MRQTTRIRLDAARNLAEGETLAFFIPIAGLQEQAFLLRFEGRLRGYLNRCPHWNVDLDLGDQRFFAPELQMIYCKNHGALFEPASGCCVAGPCVGSRLASLTVEEQVDAVWVEWEPPAIIV